MKRLFMALAVLLAVGVSVPAQEKQTPKDTPDKKEPTVTFVTLQTTAASLQGKKVKAVEVTTEAGPAQELANVQGMQGEPPVPAGKYVPQTLVIDLEGNHRIQATAYFLKPVAKGTKLTEPRP